MAEYKPDCFACCVGVAHDEHDHLDPQHNAIRVALDLDPEADSNDVQDDDEPGRDTKGAPVEYVCEDPACPSIGQPHTHVDPELAYFDLELDRG